MQTLRVASAAHSRWQVLQLTAEACGFAAGSGRGGGPAVLCARGFASDSASGSGSGGAGESFGTRLWRRWDVHLTPDECCLICRQDCIPHSARAGT